MDCFEVNKKGFPRKAKRVKKQKATGIGNDSAASDGATLEEEEDEDDTDTDEQCYITMCC